MTASDHSVAKSFKSILGHPAKPENASHLAEVLSSYPDQAAGDRDGEQHVVVYGVPGATTPGSGLPIVFEAMGENGVRIVGFSDGLTKEIDNDEEYNRLLKSVQSMNRKKK